MLSSEGRGEVHVQLAESDQIQRSPSRPVIRAL